MDDFNASMQMIDNISAGIERRDQAIRRLFERCTRLSAKLDEIAEFAAERHDTVDGPNGEPMPNDWMKVSNIIEGR